MENHFEGVENDLEQKNEFNHQSHQLTRKGRRAWSRERKFELEKVGARHDKILLLMSFLQNPLKSGIFAFHPLCGGCRFRVKSDKVEFVAIQ